MIGAALAVAVGAAAQSVSGIGFVLVCGPFLVGLLGAAEGVRLAVVLSVLVNAALLAREWRRVLWRPALLLLVPAAVATPLWRAVLRPVPPQGAALVAGLVTLGGVAVVASGRRIPGVHRPLGAAVTGVTSAGMTVAAAIGGPAAAVYADSAGWREGSARPTLQAYFLGLNLVALVTLGVRRPPPLLLVGLLAGGALGAVLAHRVPASVARRVTLGLATAGGLWVVGQALVG